MDAAPDNVRNKKDFLFDDALAQLDPEIHRLVKLEDERQKRKIILIASESLAPRAVKQALDTSYTNLYAEGYPSTRMIRSEERPLFNFEHHLSFFRRYYDRRYYKGCDNINFVEALCQQRAAELFATDRFDRPDFEFSGPKVSAKDIFVNVQSLSGAAANNAVYEAFLTPGDTVMGMALNSGGHLTHGSPVNRSGKRFNIVSYTINRGTGKLDYDEIRKLALEHRPKLIIAGYSAYPWAIDWAAFRSIADELGNGCILLADISHPSGLVVAGQFPSPIGIADVTMTTTHKTLCGPRGALLLTTENEKADKIDFAVFPGEQGGPHINNILGIAVALKLGMSEAFRKMQKKIRENALYLCRKLEEMGLKPAYGGTESHLFLLDLKSLKGPYKYSLRGEVASRILDLCGITLNKNTIAGDTNANHPTAIRIGTTWITQRGFGEAELDRLAELIHKALTNAIPYNYIGPSADLGRAKIDFKVMEEVKGGVHELLSQVKPDLPEGHPLYPHYSFPSAAPAISVLDDAIKAAGGKIDDEGGKRITLSFDGKDAEVAHAKGKAGLAEISRFPLVEVSGERALNFLNDVLTLDLRAMEPGACCRTFMLDADGKLFCSVDVQRFERDATLFDRFRLAFNRDNGDEIVAWLRGLSDGYISFDRDDLFRKVEGPVVIHHLGIDGEPAARVVRMAVLGPKAESILSGVIPDAKGLKEGQFARATYDGSDIELSRPKGLFNVGGIEIHVPADKAAALWNALLKQGGADIKALGREAIAELLDEGLDGCDRPFAPILLERMPEGFDLTKPYFIGRGALPEAEAMPEYEYKPEEGPLKRTPLFEEHLKLGAKDFIVPFAGWEMPVWYTRVSDEHYAVRTAAGLFDVAHMGVFEVTGPDATRFLDMITTNFVVRMVDGQAQYNYLLYPDGSVIDDIMIYRLAWDNYQVVCNAANEDKVLDWVNAVNSGAVRIDNANKGARMGVKPRIRNLKDPSSGDDRRIDIALQGPASLRTLKAMTEDAGIKKRLDRLAKSHLIRTELAGIPVIVSRTGYTGEEYGYELFVHPDRARDFWNAVLEAGEPIGVKATGLGSRDSTRTEAGFPLYGHELAGEFDVDPIEASYGSFVKFHKPFFIGRGPMLERWLKPRKKQVIRFRITTKNPRNIRNGDPVVDRSGRFIGNVTSCALINGKLKGLALVDQKNASTGSKIAIIPLPPNNRVPKTVRWNELKSGDQIIINERAVVLPRFPMRS